MGTAVGLFIDRYRLLWWFLSRRRGEINTCYRYEYERLEYEAFNPFHFHLLGDFQLLPIDADLPTALHKIHLSHQAANRVVIPWPPQSHEPKYRVIDAAS